MQSQPATIPPAQEASSSAPLTAKPARPAVRVERALLPNQWPDSEEDLACLEPLTRVAEDVPSFPANACLLILWFNFAAVHACIVSIITLVFALLSLVASAMYLAPFLLACATYGATVMAICPAYSVKLRVVYALGVCATSLLAIPVLLACAVIVAPTFAVSFGFWTVFNQAFRVPIAQTPLLVLQRTWVGFQRPQKYLVAALRHWSAPLALQEDVADVNLCGWLNAAFFGLLGGLMGTVAGLGIWAVYVVPLTARAVVLAVQLPCVYWPLTLLWPLAVCLAVAIPPSALLVFEVCWGFFHGAHALTRTWGERLSTLRLDLGAARASVHERTFGGSWILATLWGSSSTINSSTSSSR